MSEKMSEKEQIPVREGLFVLPSLPSGKPYLIGSKCRSCGEVAFPKRHHCRRCTSADLEEVTLGRTAKLHSFTTVRVKIPDAKVSPPFLVGLVELPEGERVRTLLTDCDTASLKIGDEMELVIDVVYQDESGNDVLGWKFRPVSGRQ